MKSPNYLMAIEASLEQKSKFSLLFFTSVLKPYDNFFSPDQRFLFYEAISFLQSLIVRQLNGEQLPKQRQTIHRNESFVSFHAYENQDMTVGFGFPYVTRMNGDGNIINDYFLFSERNSFAKATAVKMDADDVINTSRYGELTVSVSTENSGLIEKLHSLIIFFNRLNRQRKIVTTEQVEGFVKIGNEYTSSLYSMESLFKPPVLKSMELKTRRIPHRIWSFAHMSFSNAAYAFVSGITSFILLITPLINGFMNTLYTFFFLFFFFKFMTAPVLALLQRNHVKKFNADVEYLNSPEQKESEKTGTDIYMEITESAMLQLNYVERLAQIQMDDGIKESFQKFVGLSKELIKESEFDKGLFERLSPLFHLYIPTVQEAINQLNSPSSTEDDNDSLLLIQEVGETINSLNQWLEEVKGESKESLLNNLKKVRNHIGGKKEGISLLK